MNDINVLSLFDGMSCGQIALKRLGIIPRVYYASEIDKHAIGQTQLNFPNTIQLGSVVDVDVSQLERIDLLIGGSPCQSFSFAGKRKGMATKCEIEITKLNQYIELKEQGFEFEGQSYLFWEYMRILTDIRKYNPDVLFLLENVEMGAKWERVLSQAIGVFGVHINSALVSAQNRKRIYWTNIRTRQEGLFGEVHSDIPQPENRGILLRDILESEVLEKYYLSDNMLNYFDKRAANFNNGKVNVRNEHDKATTLCASMSSCDISDNFVLGIPDKSFCIDANYHKGASVNQYLEKHRRQLVSDSFCVAMVGRKLDENGVRKDNSDIRAVQRLEPNLNGKTNCLTSVQKDNLIMQLRSINDRVEGVSFNEEGIRPHRGDYRKSGIQELGTIALEHTKTSCLTTNHEPKALVMQLNPANEFGNQPRQQNRVYDTNGISPALLAGMSCGTHAILELNERQKKNFKELDEKANTFLSTSWKGSQANEMTLVLPEATSKGYTEINPGECFDAENMKSATRRGRKMEEKSNCLMAKETDFMHFTPERRIRRLTPTECARLQTVPDWYIWQCSDTQQYRMLGNGWTVEVIAHIFSFIPEHFKNGIIAK